MMIIIDIEDKLFFRPELVPVEKETEVILRFDIQI